MTNAEKNNVLNICNVICEELLDIDTPKIIFARTSEMSTATTKALAVVSDDKGPEVFIDPNLTFDPELILCLGHELRHVYQFYAQGLRSEFDSYMNSKELSTEEYNMQTLELDANAFGSICMKEITGYKPLWNGFSEELKEAISFREKYILKTEFQ